ncbi:MAG: hypothetical protein LUO93_05975 [Methanomicrobiales archaeon]|nr:hypothetical protein [Methanomicrobiales archaeon]
MEVIELDLPDKLKTKHLPFARTLLLPIGDVHYSGGGENDPCAQHRLREWIEAGIEAGAYFIGMGDYIDVASPSNRTRLGEARLYDSVRAMIDDGAQRHVDGFLDLVRGTEGRWLGLLEGHHFHEFEDGTTSDILLAQALQAPFLGHSAMLKLLFRKDNTHSMAVHSKVIWCHHGQGGGLLTSAPLNRLEHVVKAFDADLYLIGHSHKRVSAPMDRVYVRWGCDPPRLDHRTVHVACTGGWLRSYLQGSKRAGRPQGTYVEQKMLPPTSLGGLKVWFTPIQTRDHTDDRMEITIEQ